MKCSLCGQGFPPGDRIELSTDLLPPSVALIAPMIGSSSGRTSRGSPRTGAGRQHAEVL